jgi:hypothetical protein
MKSFLQGRPVQQGAPLRSLSNSLNETQAKEAGDGHTHSAKDPGHSVECIKQGDKVVRLIVTCTCGERIEIECIYPSGT